MKTHRQWKIHQWKGERQRRPSIWFMQSARVSVDPRIINSSLVRRKRRSFSTFVNTPFFSSSCSIHLLHYYITHRLLSLSLCIYDQTCTRTTRVEHLSGASSDGVKMPLLRCHRRRKELVDKGRRRTVSWNIRRQINHREWSPSHRS